MLKRIKANKSKKKRLVDPPPAAGIVLAECSCFRPADSQTGNLKEAPTQKCGRKSSIFAETTNKAKYQLNFINGKCADLQPYAWTHFQDGRTF